MQFTIETSETLTEHTETEYLTGIELTIEEWPLESDGSTTELETIQDQATETLTMLEETGIIV